MSTVRRAKWVVPAGVAFFAACFLTVFVVASVQQDRVDEQMYAGASPEMRRFLRAQSQGPRGWAELQDLMLSSDTTAAEQAAWSLVWSSATPSDTRSLDLFLEQIPNVKMRDAMLRSIHLDADDLTHCSELVRDADPKFSEGALLMLAHRSSGYGASRSQHEAICKNLTEAVALAGDLGNREKLVEALVAFAPSDVTPLLDALTTGDKEAKVTALRALAELGRTDALADVRRLKSDPDAEVAEAAEKAEKRLISGGTP